MVTGAVMNRSEVVDLYAISERAKPIDDTTPINVSTVVLITVEMEGSNREGARFLGEKMKRP